MDIKKIILQYFPEAVLDVITIKKEATKTFIELFPGNSINHTAILYISEKDFLDKKFFNLKIIHEISHFLSGYYTNDMMDRLNKLRGAKHFNSLLTFLINLIGLLSGQTLKNELSADFKSLKIINDKTNYTKDDYLEFIKQSINKQGDGIILKILFILRRREILKFT